MTIPDFDVCSSEKSVAWWVWWWH